MCISSSSPSQQPFTSSLAGFWRFGGMGTCPFRRTLTSHDRSRCENTAIDDLNMKCPNPKEQPLRPLQAGQQGPSRSLPETKAQILLLRRGCTVTGESPSVGGRRRGLHPGLFSHTHLLCCLRLAAQPLSLNSFNDKWKGLNSTSSSPKVLDFFIQNLWMGWDGFQITKRSSNFYGDGPALVTMTKKKKKL